MTALVGPHSGTSEEPPPRLLLTDLRASVGLPQEEPLHEISAARARKLWGVSQRTAQQLVETGFIRGRVSPLALGNQKVTLFVADPTWSPAERFREVEELGVPLRDVAAFHRFDRWRTLTHSTDRELPAWWMAAYLSLPDQYEGHSSWIELSAVVSLSHRCLKSVVKAIELAGKGTCAERPVRWKSNRDPLEVLREQLGPDAPVLEGTCLDPAAGDVPKAITPNVAARLMEVPSWWRPTAIADVAYSLSIGDDCQPGSLALSHERIGRALQGLAVTDVYSVRARLLAYVRGELGGTESRRSRIRAAFHFMACARRRLAWLQT